MDEINILQVKVIIFLGSEKIKFGNPHHHTVTLVDFLVFLMKFFGKG